MWRFIDVYGEAGHDLGLIIFIHENIRLKKRGDVFLVHRRALVDWLGTRVPGSPNPAQSGARVQAAVDHQLDQPLPLTCDDQCG